MKKMYETLEYNKVLEMLAEHALSENAKNKILNLQPFLSEANTARHLNETTEAREIIENWGNPPLSPMNELDKSLSLVTKGSLLLPEQLTSIAQFITTCRRLKSYLKKAENRSNTVALYGNSMHDLSELEDEIYRSIRGSQVDDRASATLANIRRKIENSGNMIKSKLETLLRNNKLWFSEDFVSVRNGHYTLPVKKEYKNQVIGAVIDSSQSGNTYFIEPAAVQKLQGELSLLHIEEENEVRRILYVLTGLVEENLSLININIQAMESLDFIFSKAKLGIAMNASPIPTSSERKIVIKGGRHPLLKAESVVPLDFAIGGDIRGVIITGPNTGGKTVALKTVGLLSLMAQSGLHVPAEDGCFTMNNIVLSDIGDGQSITENLSTFSSHMTNIIEILRTVDDQSLVLLDELGSGTDPAEGMGLATAILEELAAKGCLFVATTHYPEIKEFARTTPCLINARMAFDRQSLMPLYRLEIGEAGESCALYIAARLGLPKRIIDKAAEAAYGKSTVIHTRNDVTNNAQTVSSMKTYEANEQTNKSNSQPTDTNKLPLQRVIKQEVKKAPENPRNMKFNIGDSVIVYPQKLIGIVYRKADEIGEVGVQIKNNKLLINHKRLKLHVPASELYPENYDFSIIFDSVENRKAKHNMSRKHDPELVVKLDDVSPGIGSKKF